MRPCAVQPSPGRWHRAVVARGTGTLAQARLPGDGAGAMVEEPNLIGCSRWCHSGFLRLTWTHRHPYVFLLQYNKSCGCTAVMFTFWSCKDVAHFLTDICLTSAHIYLHCCAERLFSREILPSHDSPWAQTGPMQFWWLKPVIEAEGLNKTTKKIKLPLE